jgi:predicted nucleic acid-binding protein
VVEPTRVYLDSAPVIYAVEAVNQVVELSREVMDRATQIRAEYGFRTSDAIHLAAAIPAHCQVFLTNDRPLTQFTEISLEVIQP